VIPIAQLKLLVFLLAVKEFLWQSIFGIGWVKCFTVSPVFSTCFFGAAIAQYDS
jgi:hypothetical protein